MRIGVVAHELEGQKTGVGRYLETLLQGAGQIADGATHQWILFLRGQPFEHPLWSRADGSTSARIEARFDGREWQHIVAWEQLRLPRLLRSEPLDVLFSPSYSLPGRPQVPSVVTLHDLSYLHRGRDLGLKERLRRRWLAHRAIRQADRVLADTAQVAREIRDTYGIDEDRIGVVPIAVGGRFVPQPEPEDSVQLEALGIEPGYLLYVGSVLPRRPLRPVLGALARWTEERPDREPPTLILAGPNRLPRPSDLDDWIHECGLQAQVRAIGYVPEATLPALYRHAIATLYPSEYEGYGLPPLESLASGTPTIVTSGLALDDLWPDYPFRAADLSVDGIYEVLHRVLAGESTPDVRREGIERTQRLTAAACAARLLQQLERAHRTGQRGRR